MKSGFLKKPLGVPKVMCHKWKIWDSLASEFQDAACDWCNSDAISRFVLKFPFELVNSSQMDSSKMKRLTSPSLKPVLSDRNGPA